MNPERWLKVNELFHTAIECEAPEERSLFLKAACSGDKTLLKEVEQLVAAYDKAGEFIQNPAFPEAVGLLSFEEEENDQIGKQFGPYKIIREIGRGGMGSVFLAERNDEEFQQQVAVKVIKRGMDTIAVLRRFRHERQILASLDHPNIAKLLDGGTSADGLPYFVMEYVEGRPVTEYAEAERLSITERLELFRQICAAVAYAHQRLIVHRDLKPSNILVTADGTPKLLDFGIAKLMHPDRVGKETMATGTGMRLMTPEYASPEQAQGLPVTTLTDVYSLGVILYELLSGRSPYHFENCSPFEFAQKISESEPVKPSDAVVETGGFRDAPQTRRRHGDAETVSQAFKSSDKAFLKQTSESLAASPRPRVTATQLKGDLDNIVLKAMRKESEQRYASVGQFSEDIRRHLVGLPVIARPITFTYRLSKFVRRNRIAVGAAALVFLILIGGIITTTWQAVRAQRQEELARMQKERAEKRFNDVRKLVRSVLFDYHDAIKDLPGSTPVRAKLVKDALEYLDSLAAEASDDASLQFELATAYERIGDVQGGTMVDNLGDTTGAIESNRKALAIFQSLADSDPQNSESRYKIAVCSRRLGTLLWETGDMTGSLDENRKGLAILKELVAKNPKDLNFRFDLGITFDRIGLILLEQGDFSGAQEHFSQFLETFEAFSQTEREDEKIQGSLSSGYSHIAMALISTGDYEKALENNRRALEIEQILLNKFPLNAGYRRGLGINYYYEGEILSKMERTREALKSHRQNLDIVEKLSASDPDNELYRADVAYALIRVGDMQFKLGDMAQALNNYGRAQILRAADTKADPTNLWKRSILIETSAKICRTKAKTESFETVNKECAQTLSMMKETAVEPTNAAIRSLFAEAYSDMGEGYAALALRRTVSPDERRKAWTTAREMYTASLQIWQDMQSREILAKDEAGKVDIILRKISECDAALNGA